MTQLEPLAFVSRYLRQTASLAKLQLHYDASKHVRSEACEQK